MHDIKSAADPLQVEERAKGMAVSLLFGKLPDLKYVEAKGRDPGH
jgi:hypothetical protein